MPASEQRGADPEGKLLERRNALNVRTFRQSFPLPTAATEPPGCKALDIYMDGQAASTIGDDPARFQCHHA